MRLVVETPRRTGSRAQKLINQARVELTDAISQKQVIQFIETIVVYKFPNLGREEIEVMLGLSELRKTKVYQEALEEGIEQGKLQTKQQIVPLLLELGLSVQEIEQRLERNEREVMLGLSELRKTKVYQEALEEGRVEGIKEGKLQSKLQMVPLLLEVGLSVQEVAQRLELDVETVTEVAENQS